MCVGACTMGSSAGARTPAGVIDALIEAVHLIDTR
jgi:hypothetical protein